LDFSVLYPVSLAGREHKFAGRDVDLPTAEIGVLIA